jgi:hypothetical protein
MPSLIGNYVATNYRRSGPGSRFGTRELVSALITIANVDLTDYTTTDNEDLFDGETNPNQTNGSAYGNFAKAIDAIQTLGEIYAIGEPTFGEGASNFTVIMSADTLGDDNFTDNSNSNNMNNDNNNATNLGDVLNTLFNESITVTYTRMRGLAYN